ncbi:MAG: proteasome subunit beta [Candidatus Woesearchaeota archaeon]
MEGLKNGLKTGTTTLGIVCKDGIVLAADKRATAGSFIAAKDVDKVIQINDNLAITTAGSVSDIQLFIKLLRAELKLKNIKTNRVHTIGEAANLASRMVYDGARQYFPSMAHFLLAGFDNTGTHLYEIYPDGSMSEIKDFISSGSGSPMVFGILENSFKENMSVKEGEDLAVRSISASMQRDAGSGNGMDVMVITRDGIKKTIQKRISAVAV